MFNSVRINRACAPRFGYAAHNFTIVRHVILNILRLNPARKGSTKTKRLLVATSDIFRAQFLGFMA